MKIALASVGNDENSEISPRPGRSKFYLVFDDKGDLLETISNPFSRGGGGAGFGVAKMLADKGIDIVVAGQLGENMEAALTARGLKYREMNGNVREALTRLIGEKRK